MYAAIGKALAAKRMLQTNVFGRSIFVLGIGLALAAAAADGRADPQVWTTIVNNGVTMPGTQAAPALFNSYNQPALNDNKLVVFRARSKGGASGGGLVHGIYQRDMSSAGPIILITARGEIVPAPNNTYYNGVLASFEEFSSTPRIDFATPLIATRGQSQPVWTFQLLDTSVVPPALTDTRIGTSGIYANPGGALQTGASLLGAAVDLDQTTLTFPWFAVPGAPAGTRFDVFPGSPAVSEGRYIAFKGNYTDPSDGVGKTGVYYRDVLPVAPPSAPPSVELIANTSSIIPNQQPGGSTKFGSTAPPSAANGFMVFTGLDIEDAPTLGGIYLAPLQPSPPLQTLVGIGDPVPGELPGTKFTAFGEGLSISSDARYVSFWGAWGNQTIQKLLICPADGNADVIAYCIEQYPNGYLVNIPLHQGIFVHDARQGVTFAVAKAGEDGFSDFLYWVFSGRPPGTGGGDDPSYEPPRWRSSAFAALSATPGTAVMTAFKGTKSTFNGIYVRRGLSIYQSLVTIVETEVGAGQTIDPEAPVASKVTAVGIERDGFRNGNLAVSVAMVYADATTSIGWAGLYLTNIATIPIAPVITNIVSRKVHGTAGTLDLIIGAGTSSPTTDPRVGPTHDILFTFDLPVTGGDVAVTEGTALAGTPTIAGNQIAVPLTGVANAQYVTVEVSNVTSAGVGASGSGSMRVGFLFGDVNRSRQVTVADVGIVNANLLQTVTATNSHIDVNADGRITLSDLGLVNANILRKLPPP